MLKFYSQNHQKVCGVMESNFNFIEIRKFLHDISAYLRNELNNSVEYQNTPPREVRDCNDGICQELLSRCDLILRQFDTKDCKQHEEPESVCGVMNLTECSYLDMSTKNKGATPSEYMDLCSPALSKEEHEFVVCSDQLKDELDDKEVYEICNVSLDTPKPLDDTDSPNCPYAGLPATHLSIQKSPKYGQLLRVEKRLFFGQTKKYYCGIMQDWLLCYGDGINSIRPTFCVHLNGVEVEHYGEGKRRDLCFQISDYDSSKKIVFQASTDIESKQWIHAIEAAIRGDFETITAADSPSRVCRTSSARKLPTPPVDTIINYCNNKDTFNDGIYEEPCPLYSDYQSSSSCSTNLVITESESLKPPDIPIKTGIKPKKFQPNHIQYEYDVPKSTQSSTTQSAEQSAQVGESLVSRSKVEFQTKVKDVHSKLSNQLTSPSPPSKAASIKRTTSSTIDTKKTTKGKLSRDKERMTMITSQSQTPTTIVKNGFWNRLNKTPPQPLIRVASMEKEKENLLNTERNSFFSCPKPSKGGKVNMIINQLEANGHLPIFTRNVERLSSAFVEPAEDCNYEPIMAATNAKF